MVMGTETQIDEVLDDFPVTLTCLGLPMARMQGLALQNVIDNINEYAVSIGLGPFDREWISKRILKRLNEGPPA